MDMENIEQFQIPKEVLERLKDVDVIRRQISEGKTFQEILEYNDDIMEKFYNIAYNLYQKQEYQKAADSFVFLTTLNPYVHNYWLGLAMSEQLNGNYQNALLSYAMAMLTNLESPVSHYQSGNCYQALGDQTNAILSYEMAVNCAGDHPEHQNIKERALQALNAKKAKEE